LADDLAVDVGWAGDVAMPRRLRRHRLCCGMSPVELANYPNDFIRSRMAG
jgi:hypothetical protein